MKFNTTIETSVTQKVVTVKHDCNDGTLRGQEYTFLVPDDYSLQKGDIVRLQTRRGEKLGVCTTNSVEVPLEVLNMLERVSIGEGKSFTGLVLGKYEYIPFEWEDDDEGFGEDEDFAEDREPMDVVKAHEFIEQIIEGLENRKKNEEEK